MRGTALNVFHAVAEALADRDGESGGVQIGDVAVGPIASAGCEIDPEDPDLLAARERPGGRVLRLRCGVAQRSRRIVPPTESRPTLDLLGEVDDPEDESEPTEQEKLDMEKLFASIGYTPTWKRGIGACREMSGNVVKCHTRAQTVQERTHRDPAKI